MAPDPFLAPNSGSSKPHPLGFAARFAPLSLASNPRNHRREPWIWIPAAAAASIVVFLVVAVSTAPPSPPVRYGIFIDAGRSGTRIHVYAYRVGKGMLLPELVSGSTTEMRVSPGLSSYADEPEKAGESLTGLLEFGRMAVPGDFWPETEVRLMATAGMRLLQVGLRDSILESCRRALRGSGFRFQDEWADVIPGSDEGIYAWVAANYALGTLGRDHSETTGIIELGGASAQGVAHESLHEMICSRDPQSATPPISEGYYMDPCAPKGYSYTSKSMKLSGGVSNSGMDPQLVALADGNFSECRSAAFKLLQKEKDKCTYQECRLGSSFVPELEGKFLATENFFYTSKFFGMSSSNFLSDLVLAGTRFCAEDFSELKKQYPTLNPEDLSQYCFSSAYIVALLHDSLGLGLEDKRVGFANQVNGMSIQWALGAFITQIASQRHHHSEGGPDWFQALVQRDAPRRALLVAACAAALIGAAWAVTRWKRMKPQPKTIYDLEKGRYYVVNRAHR